MVAILAVMVVAVGAAEARSNLNGTYASTQERSCSVTITANNFGTDASGAPTLIPSGGVFRQIGADYSTVTYNPDGTGTSVGQSHTMNISNNAVGASIFSISNFSFSFTYTVNDDNTVDIQNGTVSSETVLGGGTGNTATLAPRQSRLQIGNGGNVLVTAPPTEIEEETLTTSVVGDGTLTQHRLCTRSATYIRK